ncbi:hypothetical protein DAPPUDRAFT_261693 [Daphnia pulex]|uniref:Uncharacterized protein n=1 Tax=Daphnia pulex TaxID=6669 RepID=E9HLG7_DAPPU|nr:hypothetical protein DAPPUDRAFT_261693 [Daphnia pulex]|eukprot:EFX67342.1 hypothetical protein DAPPUDRAFT_261693 [Daphnia pulex]
MKNYILGGQDYNDGQDSFTVKQKNHRCCSSLCNANKSKSSQSTPLESNPTGSKRSFALSPSSEVASQSKKGKTDFDRFLDENTASTIPALSKDELVSRLLTAVGFLHSFSNVSPTVASLEDKVLKLSTSLEEKNDLICDLEEEIVNNKVSFANSILKLNQSAVSSPTCASGQTYASVARSSLPGAVLVAKCVDGGSSAVLDVQSVEKLLDTPNSGLIPSHVRPSSGYRVQDLMAPLVSYTGDRRLAVLQVLPSRAAQQTTR